MSKSMLETRPLFRAEGYPYIFTVVLTDDVDSRRLGEATSVLFCEVCGSHVFLSIPEHKFGDALFEPVRYGPFMVAHKLCAVSAVESDYS